MSRAFFVPFKSVVVNSPPVGAIHELPLRVGTIFLNYSKTPTSLVARNFFRLAGSSN
jgi:hypothetical protein